MRDIEEIKRILQGHTIEEGEDGLRGMYSTRGVTYCYIFSYGGGWEHVSISIKSSRKLPTWDEMCMFKDIFFKDTETVVQYHLAKVDYVNNHEYVLHLWRPTLQELPKPPKIFV